jgi:geranylgeranyl pyrophosphate synthase
MEHGGRRNAGLVDRHEPAAVLLARFERALEETVCALAGAADSPVGEHVRWHLEIGSGGGRGAERLRARALLHVALGEGATFDQAVDAALAVELVHAYALVHAQAEDAGAPRHGGPAVRSRYGLANGVNAGDALCALAYATLLRNGGGLPAERVVEMARVLHRANLALVGGTTAVLFGAACELGAICAGAGRRRARAYGELGRCCDVREAERVAREHGLDRDGHVREMFGASRAFHAEAIA